MKEGLDKAGIKVHLAFQPLGYFCPDAGRNGYTDLAEWPYGTYTVSIMNNVLTKLLITSLFKME
jgi:hypothetical protein